MTMKSAEKGCLVVMWLLLLPGSHGSPEWSVGKTSSPERPSQGRMGPWVQVHRFEVPRYVAVGDNVSLECDYVVQQHAILYSLKWYKGYSQFYQYIPSKTQPLAVFSVPGLHRLQLAGGHEGRRVVVLGVGVGASDVYRCELVAEGPPFHTTQRSANMTVVVVPRGPPTITGSKNFYQLDQMLHLNCTAPLARPAPALTWTLNGQQVGGSSVWPVDEAGLESARTQLSLRVAQHHFQGGVMTIVCEARLASLYSSAHQLTIPEPSTTWFSSLNLYHSSDAGKTSGPTTVLVQVTAWITLTLCQNLS